MRTKTMTAFAMVILLGISALVMGVEVASGISHTDPAGDADFFGSASVLADDADITLLEVDDSSDPVVFTLTVTGKISLETTDNTYFYFFYIDQDGDSDSESTIQFNIMPEAVMVTGSSELGSVYFMVTGSGDDTNTLTFEVSAADLGSNSNPILDAYAEVIITDGQYNSATDAVNEGFGDDTSVDDDDDTTTDDDDDTPSDDADGDGMLDSWEETYGLDTTRDDSLEDLDGDGYDNFEEYIWDTAPNDINDYPDYSGGDDDDDWDDEMIPDPLKETATDTSIGVTIDDVKMSLDKSDGSFEVEQKGSGTTEGGVDHCSMTIVTYYDDGTYDADEWTVGPEIEERTSFMGMTFEMYFKGAGPDGDDDWSKWEMFTYVKAPESMLEDLIDSGLDDDDDGNESDEPKVTGAHLVIRAYSDDGEENWNQESADIKEMYEKFLEGEEFNGALSGLDGGEDSPAPGMIIVLGTLSIVALIGAVAGLRKRE